MGERGINGAASNAVMGVVVGVTMVLGVSAVIRAAATAAGAPLPDERFLLVAAAGVTGVLAVPVARGARQGRKRGG